MKPRTQESRPTERAIPPGKDPATARAETQSGITRDKIAGYDPAAAPLETDDEAGGSPVRPELVSADPAAMRTLPPEQPNAAGIGDAMRPYDRHPSTGSSSRKLEE
jgi:hypothetical protein